MGGGSRGYERRSMLKPRDQIKYTFHKGRMKALFQVFDTTVSRPKEKTRYWASTSYTISRVRGGLWQYPLPNSVERKLESPQNCYRLTHRLLYVVKHIYTAKVLWYIPLHPNGSETVIWNGLAYVHGPPCHLNHSVILGNIMLLSVCRHTYEAYLPYGAILFIHLS